MFSKAIVRAPSESMVSGLTEAGLGLPNYALACQQHQDYIAALRECGLEVTELPPLLEYPDSCFVEDVALLTPCCAILTRPGAPTRRGEVRHIETAIRQNYADVESISGSATIEAGDIMMVGDHYYIGLSDRTNLAGAEQIIEILGRYSLSGSVVEMSEMLHLKTGLSYLEHNNLVVCGEFVDHPEMQKFAQIKVLPDNAYSANCVWINDTVLVPAGFPETSTAIQALSYRVREVEMSEFQKLDGGLSCLSLRF